ncbi:MULTISPECIES: hypothetical protein [Gordonia]|jgi:hypothetical protein|uniref:Uncharacterized protein n=1 Tax=Gordonia sihwensis NBRC 108236 TaxID=1223544 RepID=L7LQG6_9ACTN|nr:MULTISPECIES: hypothetical protein [Gordonia]WFN95189.1 hypothetical protein P5P27_20340 [Gordonia sihwensis]WFN95191.1 hypothetical protein P5P27_20475 [Gordonia sihwensis]GAC62333.1 hypothetical protein GSI01S_33_00190 [Gordonia sihwensis NBRC 108236]
MDDDLAKKARSLGIDSSVAPAPLTTVEGVPIGKELVGKGRLLGSWEDMHLDIWGPRQGKSTSRIIRQSLNEYAPKGQ